MSPKILSVDDSKTVRALLARLLRPYACELCEAAQWRRSVWRWPPGKSLTSFS